MGALPDEELVASLASLNCVDYLFLTHKRLTGNIGYFLSASKDRDTLSQELNPVESVFI